MLFLIKTYIHINTSSHENISNHQTKPYYACSCTNIIANGSTNLMVDYNNAMPKGMQAQRSLPIQCCTKGNTGPVVAPQFYGIKYNVLNWNLKPNNNTK